MSIKCSYIKKNLRNYSWFNYGTDGKKAKRNRRIGNHIIRQRLKRELAKQMQ